MNIKSIMRRMTILALLIFVGTLTLLPAQAGLSPIPGFSFGSIVVCRDYLVINFDYTGGGATVDVEIFSNDSEELFASTTIALSAPGGQIIIFLNPNIVADGESIGIDFFNDGVGASFTDVTASGLCAPEEGEVYIPCFNDGRLDPYNCAAPVALYLSFDDDGWMLQVWIIDENGNGSFLFLIFSEDVPTAGDENILLLSENGVALYLLSTGEFQINAPYSEAGKFYVLIFDIPVGEYTRGDFSVFD